MIEKKWVFKKTPQHIKMQKMPRWTCFLSWCKWAHEILKARLNNPRCPERFWENTAGKRESPIFLISRANVQCTRDDILLLKNWRDRKNRVVERQCYVFRRSKFKGWTTAPQSSVFSGIHARKKKKKILYIENNARVLMREQKHHNFSPLLPCVPPGQSSIFFCDSSVYL